MNEEDGRKKKFPPNDFTIDFIIFQDMCKKWRLEKDK